MMTRRLVIVFSVLLLLALGAVLVNAQDSPDCKVITFFDIWARPTVAGEPNGAVYGLLTNLSSEADTLLSASTDAAEAAELHEMSMGAGDVMQMRPIEGGIMVAARNFVQLQPGGMHIMLVNLKQPLVAGETLALTLTFENLGEVKVDVPIKDMEAAMGDMGSDSGMGDMNVEATAESDSSMDMASQPDMATWPEACVGMHVVGGWARPAVAGMPNSAAYGLVVNLTAEDETLVGVSTAAADVAELHEMTMGAGDVMQMRPIEGGIVIPAGGTALLQPGGMHMMFIGLTQALDVGTSLDLTLTFAQSGTLNLSVPVQEPPMSEMGGS